MSVKSAYNAAAITVDGIEPQYQEIRTIDVDRGRKFGDTDEDAGAARRDHRLDATTQLFGTREQHRRNGAS